MVNFQDKKTLEKYSSAITLSDMEIYIFPEIMYALVLANIMSPRLWAWKQDPWFQDLPKMTFVRKVQRLKQYIMDHYSFNLDLDTWGLTTKPRELQRFSEFVDPEFFSRSNALFGYEGDKYYFDIDIRRHFGLDKYHGDVIPYWKTETVEAMDAFRHKPGYHHGAGECVSLAALYAAAFYVVLEVSLDDIFIIATPLHSQSYLAQEEGVLTNNRRLVTKTMWFNGSELSAKARRALEHERVTLVSHISGHIHIDFPEATINPEHYARFRRSLDQFLSTAVDFEIFANFLRVYEKYRRYFQIEYAKEGHRYYLPVEVLYKYEHDSKSRVGDKSRGKLLEEVESEEFNLQPYADRYILNVIEKKLNGRPLFCREQGMCEQLSALLPDLPDLEAFCNEFVGFTCVHPRLPELEKHFHSEPLLSLPAGMDRLAITAYLESMRSQNTVADLAFYAARRPPEQPEGWEPYLRACLERNPVSILAFKSLSAEEVFQTLSDYPRQSIYDGDALATPDEVTNYRQGDGFEKAVCLANVIKARDPEGPVSLVVTEGRAVVRWEGQEWAFEMGKNVVFPEKIL
jgi:hypothetical protein